MVRTVKKPLKILALVHPTMVPPDDLTGYSEKEIHAWKTEYDVVSTLRKLGHEVRVLGVQYELAPIRDVVTAFAPDVVFNLLEEFHQEPSLDYSVPAYLELLRVPYTGCNPRGMMISRGKALSKQLLTYHRIRVPRFAVFPRARKIRRPGRLTFPLIVKSLVADASVGISRASVVDNDAKLAERVAFVHERIGTDAIAEEYIPGREIYVAVLGNDRLTVLPTWELEFGNLPPDAPQIATERIKHDIEHQDRMGILQGPAEDLPTAVENRIGPLTRRIYRILELDGYARIDYRLSDSGELYFLEANQNPEIAQREEFASSAHHAGIEYPELLQRIVRLGMSRSARSWGG